VYYTRMLYVCNIDFIITANCTQVRTFTAVIMKEEHIQHLLLL
jgi:hypothetical protein